ncbi:MAG: hypothetical protein KDI65_10625 [Alphaproteobacteria bacterium]|nr:hypothetical protein [Alphaproteobacteria bacterium]
MQKALSFIALIIVAFPLAGCGSRNMDAECAALFEDLSDEFDEIIAEGSAERRIEHLKNLRLEKDILSLQKRAAKRIDEKIGSGEIWSELNPDAPKNPPKPKLVLDELNKRKIVAMNGFNSRWFKVRDDEKYKAGLFKDDDSALMGISKLQSMCNQTLR